MSDSTRTCACTVQQYKPIVFNTVADQANANTVYQNWLITQGATGPRQFKSDYERMQYLLGRQNQASCGVPARTRALDTN
jgi:hypothetical protein